MVRVNIPADPRRKKLRELEKARGNPHQQTQEVLERIELKLDLLLEKLEAK